MRAAPDGIPHGRARSRLQKVPASDAALGNRRRGALTVAVLDALPSLAELDPYVFSHCPTMLALSADARCAPLLARHTFDTAASRPPAPCPTQRRARMPPEDEASKAAAG